MNEELVSIVVPVYNVKQYLRRCVNSLIQQTYSNIEILLIDDGSKDGSAELCDEFASMYSNVNVIHQKNAGLSAARNTGTMHARGKYICYVDSDDYCDLDMVEYLFYLKNTYRADMSVCGIRVIYDNRKLKNKFQYGDKSEECLDSYECIEKMLYNKGIDVSACAKLYKTELMKKIPYPLGKKHEDIGTTYKIFMACERIACGYSSKYNYCIRSNSITTSSVDKTIFDMLELADKMCRDVVKRYPSLVKAVIRYRVYVRFVLYNRISYSAEFEKERAEIEKFILAHRISILFNPFVPIRDRLAILLFTINRTLYIKLWELSKK